MSGKDNNIPSIRITADAVGPASSSQSPPSCLLSPTSSQNAYDPLSPTMISDLDAGSIPPSPTLSSHSGAHFHTSVQVRDNQLREDQSLTDKGEFNNGGTSSTILQTMKKRRTRRRACDVCRRKRSTSAPSQTTSTL